MCGGRFLRRHALTSRVLASLVLALHGFQSEKWLTRVRVLRSRSIPEGLAPSPSAWAPTVPRRVDYACTPTRTHSFFEDNHFSCCSRCHCEMRRVRRSFLGRMFQSRSGTWCATLSHKGRPRDPDQGFSTSPLFPRLSTTVAPSAHRSRRSSTPKNPKPEEFGLVTSDRAAFQIDGNLGFVAGVNEMLLQSRYLRHRRYG